MNCPECHKADVIRAGLVWRARKRVQQYQCTGCGLRFTVRANEESRKA